MQAGSQFFVSQLSQPSFARERAPMASSYYLPNPVRSRTAVARLRSRRRSQRFGQKFSVHPRFVSIAMISPLPKTISDLQRAKKKLRSYYFDAGSINVRSVAGSNRFCIVIGSTMTVTSRTERAIVLATQCCLNFLYESRTFRQIHSPRRCCRACSLGPWRTPAQDRPTTSPS